MNVCSLVEMEKLCLAEKQEGGRELLVSTWMRGDREVCPRQLPEKPWQLFLNEDLLYHCPLIFLFLPSRV